MSVSEASPPKEAITWARLRLLWGFARPHRARLVMGLLLALAGSAMGLATPMVTKWVLDSLGADTSLSGPIAALAVLLVFGAVIWTTQWILLGALGERVVFDARRSMVRRFFGATVPALSRRSPGELVTRVTSDTVLLREAASQSVIGLLNGAVMLVGTLVLMAVLDLVLLATTVGAVIVVGIVFAVLMPPIAKAQQRAQEHIGHLGGALEAGLRAIRTVKVSRAEQRTSQRVIDSARESMRYSIKSVRREAVAWTVSWSGIQLAIIMILGIGAWRVGLGELQVSALIAFLLYAFGLMEPIMELSQNLTTLQTGIAAAGRIREIDSIDVESADVEPVTATVEPDPGTPVLELRGITAAYGPDREPAVADVDLVIPRTGHVAIVGPSGAGKTTLFSLLLRFLEPQRGTILLDGEPYGSYSHAGVREHLAYVEQETPVVPGTIADNLLLTHPDADADEMRRALAEVRLTELVDGLDAGLDTSLSTSSVSGGQRQRLALARAILRTPPVLLLDEATAQVDGITEAAIQDCIRRRAQTGAVVTIAHRLSTVVDADLIVVMQDGRIRARGSHDELLRTDDLYRDLVEALRIADQPAPVAS